MRISFIISIIIVATSLSSQETIHVPSDFATIQLALDASTRGDTILVAPGTYFENLSWPSFRDLHLIGQAGSAETILDGGGTRRVLNIEGVTEQSLLKGFTIQNGFNNGFGGSGIYVYSSSLSLEDLNIKDNIVTEYGLGGGANLDMYSGIITNCEFSNNVIQGNDDEASRGSGVHLSANSFVEFSLCQFNNNKLTSQSAKGGGIYIENRSNNDVIAIFNSCTFSENSIKAKGLGGGAAIYFAGNNLEARIDSCLFIGNTTTSGACTIGGFNDRITILNSTFKNNNSGFLFGAVLEQETGTTLIGNCRFIENELDSNYTTSILLPLVEANMSLLNCEIRGNGCPFLQVGLPHLGANIISLQYCTVANNEEPSITEEDIITISESIIWNNGGPEFKSFIDQDVEITNSIVQGYEGEGENILDADPLFISVDNLKPSNSSPAINAGISSIVFDTDLNGSLRPSPPGTNPDLGCYEVNQDLSSINESNKKSMLRLFPNPASSYITLPYIVDKVALHDYTGSLIKSANNTSGLDVQDVPEGAYIIWIEHKGLSKKESVIINH